MIHEQLTYKVIAAIYAVHNELGPGLFESCYEQALIYELTEQGMHVQTQVGLPVIYKGHNLDLGFRLDILVDDAVIVEIKSAEFLHDVYKKQLLTYLKLSSKRVGLLVNFNADSIKSKESLFRIVN